MAADSTIHGSAVLAGPKAVLIRGREGALERFRHGIRTTMKQLDPRKTKDTHRLTASCVGKDALIHEFSSVMILPDGRAERCYTLAVVPFVGDRMFGERTYSDRFYADMREATFGPELDATPHVTQL